MIQPSTTTKTDRIVKEVQLRGSRALSEEQSKSYSHTNAIYYLSSNEFSFSYQAENYQADWRSLALPRVVLPNGGFPRVHQPLGWSSHIGHANHVGTRTTSHLFRLVSMWRWWVMQKAEVLLANLSPSLLLRYRYRRYYHCVENPSVLSDLTLGPLQIIQHPTAHLNFPRASAIRPTLCPRGWVPQHSNSHGLLLC